MSPIVIAIIAAVCGLAVGALVVHLLYKRADATISAAKTRAKKIIEDGEAFAQTKKRELLLEAKDEIQRERAEAERELKERRREQANQERRVQQKEDNLDRKRESLERKEEELARKIQEAAETEAEVQRVLAGQLAQLERLAGLTADEAKSELVSRIENEARHDAAQKLIEIEAQLKDEADERARNMITMAIQRCASDHVSEVTVSVVTLPNDDMKGRIIGREGRNIRTIETLTGVDLIIDDTPEAITLSSFDPVRREIARLTLEKLISDGRIHPSRIEETVERSRKDVEAIMKQAGEQACFEAGVHNIPPELVRILGRLKYRTSYGQNVLRHSIEVSQICGLLAGELGVDVTLAKRAGLLHDIGKAMTHEVEGTHIQIGVDLAKKHKENKDIIHAIEAHHNDVEPRTLVAMIVQAADAISAARPGARREDLENYIKRLRRLEEIATSVDGVEKSYAVQAGREIRIMVKPEQVDDLQMALIAKDVARQIEEGLEYPGQIKVNVIRESRSVEYAK